MKNLKNILFSLILFTMTTGFAQKPTEVPKPSEKPIDLTNPADIIIYIVLPLCAVLLFFIWRGKRKRKNQ
ncbi:adenylosuccinate synthetase [Aequorivita todarodis]|uniref:adenylosuccinate synthetase n=1 Tax=Aequorivita todarodis TaxID=2036821 RepID=UPI002350727D|nr:adenylosuccinate synthetase [Aequorivita todarodis]MDC7999970.1 adenylosuccinate synthetase [Aequorivita todarodis]